MQDCVIRTVNLIFITIQITLYQLSPFLNVFFLPVIILFSIVFLWQKLIYSLLNNDLFSYRIYPDLGDK